MSRLIKPFFYRAFICNARDPLNLPVRFFGFLTCGILISLIYGSEVGKIDGCNHDFSIGDGINLIEKFTETHNKLFDNGALLAFTCMLAWFSGIFPVLLLFPMELNIFVQVQSRYIYVIKIFKSSYMKYLQEYGNGYYSAFSYFVSKVVTDLAYNLTLPNLASLAIFFLTGQYWEVYWRIFSFSFIFVLVTLNASSLGLTIGSSLVDYPTAIAFVGILSLVPCILLSGTFKSVIRNVFDSREVRGESLS